MATVEEQIILAEEQLRQGQLDRAAESFAEALEADHQNLPASLGLARISMALSMAEQAETILDRTLGFAPENIDVLLLRALCDEGRGRLQDALVYFQKAAKLAPRSYPARYQYGRALVTARRYRAAIRELSAATTLGPNLPDPHYVLGIAYKELGQLGQAVTAFTRIIELDPTHLDGYVTLADVLCEAGKLDAALKVLEQAQSIYPDVGAVYDKLAAIHVKRNDLPSAVEALRNQARVEPANEIAHVNLITVALAASDGKTAAEAVETLIDLAPESWRGYYLRAKLFDMGDRVDRALEDLARAHELAPHRWEPLNDRGTLLNALAQDDSARAEEAVECLKKAAHLAPDEPSPRFNLALAYWNAGRREESRGLAQELVETLPETHSLWGRAREILEAMGEVA